MASTNRSNYLRRLLSRRHRTQVNQVEQAEQVNQAETLPKAQTYSSLELLPLELKQQILTAIDDIFSLKAAILSCPALYAAYHGAERLITKAVMENHRDLKDFLSEAVAAVIATKIAPLRDQQAYDAFLRDHLALRSDRPHQWTLQEGLDVAQTHADVRFLAERFASQAFQQRYWPNYNVKSRLVPPSPGELKRIKQSLYHFELFCRLFGSGERDLRFQVTSVSFAMASFLSGLSRWELQQLQSIHLFLCRSLQPSNFVFLAERCWLITSRF